MNKIIFGVAIEGYYEFAVEEVWPDGDAPDNPTPEDVRNVMQDAGTKNRVLDDWGLLSDLNVTVDAVKVWAAQGSTMK